MKIISSLFLALLYTVSFAQTKLKSEKLVTTFKINKDTYFIYLQKVGGGLNTDGYNINETGEAFVIYSKMGKIRKKELTFPKVIRNDLHKISREGSYQINTNSISITQKYYDYQFSAMGSIQKYSQNKYRQLIVETVVDIEINESSLSDEYVKKVALDGPPEPANK